MVKSEKWLSPSFIEQSVNSGLEKVASQH